MAADAPSNIDGTNRNVGDRSDNGRWWRQTISVAVAIALGFGILWAVSLFALPLALLVGGIAIATALEPIVQRLAGPLPRAAAVIIVFLVLLLIAAGLGWLAVPPVTSQGQQVVQELPQMIDAAQQRLSQWIPLQNISLQNVVSTGLQNMGSSIVAVPQRLIRGAFHLLVIVFISLYLLILAPAAINFILSLFPEDSKTQAQNVMGKMAQAMGGYVRGVFIDSIIVGILTYIGLLLIGLDFALVLAVVSGVLEIVPVVGPVLAGIIMVGVALLQAPEKALLVLGFAVILQQIESSVIVPNVMRAQTRISPVLTILALIAGERLGGVIGALVAIPLAAALRVFVTDVIAPAVRRRTGAQTEQEKSNSEANDDDTGR